MIKELTIYMAIWITGDIHGNPSRLSTDIFPGTEEDDQKGLCDFAR